MAHNPKKTSDVDEGAEKRRDAGITRMLNTPPKPHKEMTGKKRPKKAQPKRGENG